MFSLTRILCRNWTRVLCCPNDQERPSQENEQKSHDDLTAIRGIGIATQDHLNKSGIWTYAQLAAASPDDLRETLSDRVTEGKTKHWIADARKLAEEAIK